MGKQQIGNANSARHVVTPGTIFSFTVTELAGIMGGMLTLIYGVVKVVGLYYMINGQIESLNTSVKHLQESIDQIKGTKK